jgi:hypothetical protein
MSPHGGSFAGTTHSHDPEFPDDNWNLYSMLEPTSTALNTTCSSGELAIQQVFRPNARKLLPEPMVSSDADKEIIFVLRFSSPANIRKIMVIGGDENTDSHPSSLKCYVNQENVDFSSISSLIPAQTFELQVNLDGTAEHFTAVRPFTTVNTLVLYFDDNHGDVDRTTIRYIGLQGEHTHYRREAVDTVYEVLCNGQDIIQPESQAGAHGHSHSHGHSHGHDHSH